jgi:abortive infection bacteriophage resistance protein
MYSKPYLTIEQQIERLASRGMTVEDEGKAREYLHRIGYYRLSAYWHPMRRRDQATGEALNDFVEGTTFKEVTDLYTFDSRLRLIVLDAIERIEVSLRTEVALTLGAHDPKAHRQAGYFSKEFTKPTNRNGPSRHREWVQKLDERFLSSKDKFAEHFRTNYPNDDMPVWIAVELLDFGPLSRLISGMTHADRVKMGASYGGIDPKQLASWSHALSFVRNVCAHHSRLWNKPLINQPSLNGYANAPADLRHVRAAPGGAARFYAIACVAQFMLRHANPRTSWRACFLDHVSTFPQSERLALEAAGFPRDWRQQALWT